MQGYYRWLLIAPQCADFDITHSAIRLNLQKARAGAIAETFARC
jgi:hypothetical protein